LFCNKPNATVSAGRSTVVHKEHSAGTKAEAPQIIKNIMRGANGTPMSHRKVFLFSLILSVSGHFKLSCYHFVCEALELEQQKTDSATSLERLFRWGSALCLQLDRCYRIVDFQVLVAKMVPGWAQVIHIHNVQVKGMDRTMRVHV